MFIVSKLAIFYSVTTNDLILCKMRYRYMFNFYSVTGYGLILCKIVAFLVGYQGAHGRMIVVRGRCAASVYAGLNS